MNRREWGKGNPFRGGFLDTSYTWDDKGMVAYPLYHVMAISKKISNFFLSPIFLMNFFFTYKCYGLNAPNSYLIHHGLFL